MESTQPTVLPWAYPLDDFYSQAGLILPAIEQIEGEAMPQPYRSLLVHKNDMTPTLEKFYKDQIHIKALSRNQRNGFYFREVVLELDATGQSVEFGAIKIMLDLFPPAARQLILAEREPLGHILTSFNVVHTSRPKAYLRISSDAFINDALKLEGSQTLYGRRNTLFDPEGRPLAEIVEILPPANLQT